MLLARKFRRRAPDGCNLQKCINHLFYFHYQLHKEFSETAKRLQEDLRCIESSAKTSAVVMKYIEGNTYSYSIKCCTRIYSL